MHANNPAAQCVRVPSHHFATQNNGVRIYRETLLPLLLLYTRAYAYTEKTQQVSWTMLSCVSLLPATSSYSSSSVGLSMTTADPSCSMKSPHPLIPSLPFLLINHTSSAPPSAALTHFFSSSKSSRNNSKNSRKNVRMYSFRGKRSPTAERCT